LIRGGITKVTIFDSVISLAFYSNFSLLGINFGVKLWEPEPSIFPDGMAAVVEQMGTLPVALHNRYFSPDNDYIKNYTFIVEQEYALPLDEVSTKGNSSTASIILQSNVKGNVRLYHVTR